MNLIVDILFWIIVAITVWFFILELGDIFKC